MRKNKGKGKTQDNRWCQEWRLWNKTKEFHPGTEITINVSGMLMTSLGEYVCRICERFHQSKWIKIVITDMVHICIL